MLKGAGFRDTDVAALLPANSGNKDLAVTKGNRAGDGFALAAVLGAIMGGALGYMLGARMIYIPRLETLQAAEPWVAALAGAGALALLFGIIGALIGATTPVYEAFRYQGRTRKGGMLLSVHCDNKQWSTLARGILRQSGAGGFAAMSQKRGDFAVTDRPVEPSRVDNLNTLNIRDVKVVRGPETPVTPRQTIHTQPEVREVRREEIIHKDEHVADPPIRWSR
jgi:hypothetical protein